jgi:hypothetical protein
VSGPALVRVRHCLGSDGALAGELEQALADRSEALLVAPVSAPDTSPEDWATVATVAVLTRLRAVLEEDAGVAGRHCLVVVVAPYGDRPEVAAAAGATAEAMRGVVQSVSREVDPAVLRLNVVIGGEHVEADLLRTVRFLSSPSGGFLVGATVDVR